MEPTPPPLSLKEKLGNAVANLSQLMRSDKKILFAVVGIGILVVVFIAVALLSFSRSGIQTTVTTETPNTNTGSTSRRTVSTQPKIPGTLSLSLGNTKAYKVNDTITVTIVGDTAGNQVRGYDAAFKFDPLKVSFVSEKNLYPAFQYQRRIRNNWVIISGTQQFSSTQKNVFSKTPLMRLTFKATAPGTVYFPISYIPDSYNDSNLIGTSSNDMLSNATGIVVQIQP